MSSTMSHPVHSNGSQALDDGSGTGEAPSGVSPVPPQPPLVVDEVAPAHRRAAWRAAAHDRYLVLADALATTWDPDDEACQQAAEQLHRAAIAFKISGFRSWWSGTVETEVFAALDLAEGHLVPVDEDERAAYVDELVLRIDRRFTKNDGRAKTATALLGLPETKGNPGPVPARSNVQWAGAILHTGNLAFRTSQKAQRNATVISGGMLLAAALTLAFSLQHKWGGIDLLGPVPAGVDPAKVSVASPWMVLLFGAFGGLLSVLPLLKRVDQVVRTTGAWTIQALFKTVSGAFLALVAAVLVQRVDLPIVKPQDAVALTAWALLFGYSQDVVTKALDDRLASAKAPTPTGTAKAS